MKVRVQLSVLLVLAWTTCGAEPVYNVYFGDTHAHTSYSDGYGYRMSPPGPYYSPGPPYTWSATPNPTPANAFAQARNAGADFMVISDHSGWEPNIYFNLNADLWALSRAQADAATVNGTFVAIVAPEHSPPYNPSAGQVWVEGHMNIHNSGTNYFPAPMVQNTFYDLIAGDTNIIAEWNHPNMQYPGSDFKRFAGWTPARSRTISMMALAIGIRLESSYLLALDRGWKVAPLGESDTHTTNWIVGYEQRTAVLATNLTRAAIYDAFRNRRCYATENKNLRINYTINGYIMGSAVPYAGNYEAAINATDPDTGKAGDRIVKIDLVSNRGAIVASQDFSSHTVDWTNQIVSTGLPAYYFYRVKNGSGEMAWTSPIWVPANRMTVTAVPAVTNQLNLAWPDVMVGEDGYEIWRSAVTNTSYALWKSVEANTTFYVDETVQKGVRYYYKVRPYVGATTYAFSAEASDVVTPGDTVAPSTPRGLALWKMSTNDVYFVFRPSTDDQLLQGYGVYRNGVELALGGHTGFGSVMLSGEELVYAIDTNRSGDPPNFLPNTTYHYRVFAIDWAGNRSALSEEFTITSDAGAPPNMNVPPAAPTNLVVTAVASNRIDLYWTDLARNESGFRLERKVGAGGAYSPLATLSSNIAVYSDAGLLSGSNYIYRVRAFNGFGDSAFAAEAGATTWIDDTQAPAVPTGLKVVGVTDRSVSLAWSPSTDNVGVVGYRILESGGVVGSSTVTNFTHSGLAPDTSYSYTVQAGDAVGNWSAASTPPVGATTLEGIPFPTNGLVGYWPLDENGGSTANDASGNGYHGTLAGANTPVWTAPGKLGASSLLFNIQNFSSPSRVDLPAGPDALAANAGFTISAWCHPDAAPGNSYCKTTVLAGQTPNNDTGGNVLGYYYNASGDYRFYMRFGYGTGNNTAYTAMSPAPSPFGVWYHVAGVVDRAGGTVKIYIDGVPAATNVFAGGTAAYAYWPTYHWKFGAWGSNREDPNYGKQTLDEVRFYNRALNATEVLALAGVAPPDTRAPTLTVLTPTNLSYTTNSQVAVTGTAADASGVASVTVNGVGASTANGFTNWNRTVTGLASGTNVVTVVAVDTPGNAGTNVVRVIYATGSFDGNGDGLPDAWQIRYFGFGFKTNALAAPDADADGDGMNNRDEQITGTNPNDPADCLKVSDAQTLPGSGFTVEWKSVSGHVYQVQWSTNLAGWTSFSPAVTATASSASATDPDANQVTNRFYRVSQP